MKRRLFAILSFLFVATLSRAQENLAPVNWRPAPAIGPTKAASKPAALTLPFFEDFTGYLQYPDATHWTDSQVYVNNTMAVGQISRGVATFDALNQRGRPYDTINALAVYYADSLTSRTFDLSGFVPGDSLYLSFFYQPQGHGFMPEPHDSLMLFFQNKNFQWQKIWSVPGSALQPFKQAMIAVADTNFLHSDFRFRFVNIASINTNDDIWNLDYIRFAAGRNLFDTAVNDLAFTAPPANLLNDYTSMPFRQFQAATGVLTASLTDSFRNNSPDGANTSVQFEATHNGATLHTWSSGGLSIPPYATMSVAPPAYNPAISAGPYEKVVIDHTYTLSDPHTATPRANDTIVHQQIFDNYLAYDDGSAEKSYYLNLFPTLPGRLAIEFYLYQPDTLRGFAVYFGQQVPTAANKFFSVFVYRELAGINGGVSDLELYTEDFFVPHFGDTANGFSYYPLAQPVAVPAGTFYFSTMQPAASGSDSLYFGLDANRTTGNHLYYNVLGTWQSSLVSGALMIRPIFGFPLSVPQVTEKQDWAFYPNPAKEFIRLQGGSNLTNYQILDFYGRIVQSGSLEAGEDKSIDLRPLPAGVYLLKAGNRQQSTTKKLIKQ